MALEQVIGELIHQRQRDFVINSAMSFLQIILNQVRLEYCRLSKTHKIILGGNTSIAEYPSDLIRLPGQADYNEIEREGLIVEAVFIRGTNYTSIDGATIVSGADEQCMKDNCSEIFDTAVNICQFHFLSPTYSLNATDECR